MYSPTVQYRALFDIIDSISIQFIFSFHTEQYNCLLFIKLSISSINCTDDLIVFNYIIHDFLFQ